MTPLAWSEGGAESRTASGFGALLMRGLSVAGFNAVGDARQASDASIANGGAVVTSTALALTSDDIGKTLVFKQAGVTASNFSSGTSLIGTILSVSGNTCTISATAARAIASGGSVVVGTPNNTPFTNALAAAGAGKSVYVPAGTYLFSNAFGFSFGVASQTIFLARGVILLFDGSGANGTGFKPTADGATFCGEGVFDGGASLTSASNAGQGAAVINCASRSNISFFDITIQNSLAFGIVANNANHVKSRGVKYINCASAAFWDNCTVAGTVDISVEGGSIDNTMVATVQGGSTILGSGINVGGIAGATACTKVKIRGVTIDCPPASTSNLDESSGCIGGAMNRSVVSHNIMSGANISVSPLHCSTTTIEGNVVYGPKLYGIELPDVSNATVSANAIDGGGTAENGIIVDGGAGVDIDIIGNTIKNLLNGLTSVGGQPAGIAVQNLIAGTLISSNGISLSFGICIVNNGGDHTTITSNRCKNTGTAQSAIFSSGGSNVLIALNPITGSFTDPIQLYEQTPATRTALVVVLNPCDSSPCLSTVNLTYGASCQIFGNGTDATEGGGTSTSTPGNVSTVNIPHGLGVTPQRFSAEPANANAAAATGFYRTADATNVVLHFSPALTAATVYAWNWSASIT